MTAYAAPSAWYTHFGDGSTTGYYAVTKRPQNSAVSAGALVRQFTAPSINNERVFACVVAGTTANTTDATWTLTKGAKSTDGTATWIEVTGQPGLNGDTSSGHCPVWGASLTPTVGVVIYDSGTSSLQVCTTSGAGGTGAAPTFSATAGVTTADASATWTSLGSVPSTWSAPHARLANAVSWGAAGNDFYIADNSAEIAVASFSVRSPGTGSLPCRILSIDHTASLPPTGVKAGATITANNNNNLTVCDTATWDYWYGISFITAGSGNGNLYICNGTNNSGSHYFKNCAFSLTNGSALPNVTIGGATGGGMAIVWDNVQLTLSSGNQRFQINGGHTFLWKNTSLPFSGGNIIELSNSTAAVNWTFEGLDFSSYSNIQFFHGGGGASRFLFKDCRLPSSFYIGYSAVTVLSLPTIVDFVRCSNGGVTYGNWRFTGQGNLTTSTAVARTGGASDGGTAVSHQIVGAGNMTVAQPMPAIPITIWNSVTGTNRNVTLYGVINAAAVPLNTDFWFDVEYYGSSSGPLGAFATGGPASVLASGSALTADTSAWDSGATARANSHLYNVGDIIKLASNSGRIFFCTTGGSSAGSEPGGYASAVDGGSVTDGAAVFRAGCRFSLTVTLSSPQPALAGYLTAQPYVNKVATLFIDPLIVLS